MLKDNNKICQVMRLGMHKKETMAFGGLILRPEICKDEHICSPSGERGNKIKGLDRGEKPQKNHGYILKTQKRQRKKSLAGIWRKSENS